MAKSVTVEIDAGSGTLCVTDGALFLGELSPITFGGYTLAEGHTLRLTVFDRDRETPLADNSEDEDVLDLRYEAMRKAFRLDRGTRTFYAVVNELDGDGNFLSQVIAAGQLPIRWSPEVFDAESGILATMKGETGAAGTNGTNGTDGADGEDGADGVTPHIGANGNWYIGEGDTGVRAQGLQGPQGIQGPKGETGAQGAAGTNGRDGEKGEKGDTGNTGPEGPRGATGPQGIQGIQGIMGPQGPQGPKGDTGDISQALTGETMRKNPTQRQMTVALKKIWTALGGTVACLLAAFALRADGLTRTNEWQDVEPTATLGAVVDAAGLAAKRDTTNRVWTAGGYGPWTGEAIDENVSIHGRVLSGEVNGGEGEFWYGITFADGHLCAVYKEVGFVYFQSASEAESATSGYVDDGTASGYVTRTYTPPSSFALDTDTADLSNRVSGVESGLSSVSSRVDNAVAIIMGESSQIIVTNYNSATKISSASLNVNVTEGGTTSTLRVWNELNRWNAWTGADFDWTAWGGFHAWRTNMETTVGYKAEREYALFDGVTGLPAPEGCFWISQSNIVVCAGASYVRYVTTGGEVWVLEANGMVPNINGTTNGFFRVTDGEGNVQFEIVKGSKRTVFAQANSMTNMTASGVSHHFVHYSISGADAAPTAYAATNLTEAAFVAQGETDCPANVSWTATADGYDLEFWPKDTACRKMFIYSEYVTGGEDYIRNAAPVAMEYLYLFGKKWAVGTNTISGKVVLTLTEAN